MTILLRRAGIFRFLMFCLIPSTGLAQGIDVLCQYQEHNQCWTTGDVIDNRIDHHAQSAMMGMLERGGAEAADASAILCAVKRGQLEGVYLPSQKVPALRAKSAGSQYWLIIPKGRDSACYTQPPDRSPLIAFRDQIKTQKPRVATALRSAWTECGIEPTAPRCYIVTIHKPACDNEKWNAYYDQCMGPNPELKKCKYNNAVAWNGCRGRKPRPGQTREDRDALCIQEFMKGSKQCYELYQDKSLAGRCRDKANAVSSCEYSR